MSFENNIPSMLKETDAKTDEEIGNETSSLRTEQKRAHRLLMDPSEGELFSSKKQVVKPASADHFSFWGSNTSDFQFASVHSSDRSCVLAPEPLGTFRSGDKNVISEGSRGFIDPLQSRNSTVRSFMSRAGKDPGYPLWKYSSYTGEDLSVNAKSLGLIDRNGIGNVTSMGHNSSAKRKELASRGNNNAYLMDQSLDKGNGAYYRTVLHQPYKEINGYFMSTPSYKKAREDFFSMFHPYGKADEDFVPVDMYGNKDIVVASKIPTTHDKAVEAVIPTDTSNTVLNQPYKEINAYFMSTPSYKKAREDFFSMFLPYGKANADFMPVDMFGNKDIVVASRIPTTPDKAMKGVISTDTSSTVVQRTSKIYSNNFPRNITTLLSTGIFDGVPVKYVSWAREKTLRGIIKGKGYLCGCDDCKLSTWVTSYEFERHAGCHTNHPTKNIFVESGKSLYAVALELKNTPRGMLFESIQNITGSPIDQKNFQIWKETIIAAGINHVYAEK